jgi:hypothetical protein
MTPAVVTRNDGVERRARVLPWGIEVQVWRLVETLTLPGTAATLPIKALFPEPDGGAIPVVRNEDEKTLENPMDDPSREEDGDLVYEDGEKGARR